MPLLEDNSILSAFRQLIYTPKTSKNRGTKGKPESSESLAEKFLSKLKTKSDNLGKIVAENWDYCVQQRFRGKSSPQNVRMNVLYVAVENPSVKQEMMFSEREILKKVQALNGCKKIKKIRFL